MTLDELIENFSLFDDWEERYRYLIDLGHALPPLLDAERIESNQVQGCMSQVWLVTEFDAETGTMRFRADSDAFIVRGLLAVLMTAYDGQSPATIVAIKAETLLARLGFDRHLSPSRRNGLTAVAGRIHATAAAQL